MTSAEQRLLDVSAMIRKNLSAKEQMRTKFQNKLDECLRYGGEDSTDALAHRATIAYLTMNIEDLRIIQANLVAPL